MILLVNLVITSLLSFVYVYFFIKYAEKMGFLDVPNERSVHRNVVPRGAGIAFGIAFFIGYCVAYSQQFIEHWHLFVALLSVFLIGILDDHKDASPKMKFLVIIAAVFLLYLDGIEIENLGTYFRYEIPLGVFALPFTIFSIVGLTNAINLIDGLDGLAASISILILSSFAYIGFVYDDMFIMNLSLFTVAILVAFLWFNWNPAKVFMGDSGSLLLGFIISVIAVLLLEYVHPVAVLYLIALPVIDTIIVMTRRIRNGISPFQADKTHMHHTLLPFFNYNVKETVSFMLLLQFIFTAFGVLLADSTDIMNIKANASVVLVAYICMVVLFYMVFTGMIRRRKLIDKLIKRKECKVL